MTVESPSAHHRPPDDYNPEIKFSSNRENSSSPTSSFHDYAKPATKARTEKITNPDESEIVKHSQKMSLGKQSFQQLIQPLFIMADHSLANDWGIYPATSPDGSSMYEDGTDSKNKALLSPCTSDTLHSPISASFRRDGFDQPMQFEEESINLTNCDTVSLWGQMDGPPIQDYLTDIINGSDGSSIKDIGDELVACIKTDISCNDGCGNGSGDSLKTGLKDKGAHQGPTLAQLNDSECVLDILAPIGNSHSWVPTSSHASAPSGSASDSSIAVSTWNSGCTYNAAIPSSSANFASPVIPHQKTRPCSSATLSSAGLIASADQVSTMPAATFDRKFLNQTTGSKCDQETTISCVVPKQVSSGKTAYLQELLSSWPPAGTAATINEIGAAQTTITTQENQQLAAVGGKRQMKRSRSPDENSNSSSNSMERKWEEIRCYIDSNIKLEEEAKQRQQQVERAKAVAADRGSTKQGPPVVKRIKTEPQDSPDPYRSSKSYISIKEEVMDSDFENSDDDFSDVESDASYGSFIEDLLHGTSKKEKRYFWQYNTQSKGPKGKRLCKSVHVQDPHNLADFEDPVFQPEVNDARYKHNGKARKGDGNDITPSPWKLFQIGNELQKLNKKINGIAVTERPIKAKDGVKSKSRKEKNKYASRACRLKKKAQHEANKLKLFGLEQEHHQLMEVLKTIKETIYNRIKHNEIEPAEEKFTTMLDREIKDNLTVMIAGNTSDYVNSVLQKVAEGDRSGAIHKI